MPGSGYCGDAHVEMAVGVMVLSALRYLVPQESSGSSGSVVTQFGRAPVYFGERGVVVESTGVMKSLGDHGPRPCSG